MSEAFRTVMFLSASGGLQDAYTYIGRGKVFANAQTGNIVLMSQSLFEGDFARFAHYFIPVLAFALGTAGGVLLGKVMCWATHGKVNPLIGAAGVSAVPMAARVAQKVGQKENPQNFLLMHAMGPNVAGVIGSAVAAGILINMLG